MGAAIPHEATQKGKATSNVPHTSRPNFEYSNVNVIWSGYTTELKCWVSTQHLI